MTTPEGGGLVYAYRLTDRSSLDWNALEAWNHADGPMWAHLDREHERAERWMNERSGLDALTVRALLDEHARPRFVPTGDGAVVILRGVNLNPGDEPDDMVALRIWIDADRIITLRHRRVMAAQDLHLALASGRGAPATPGTALTLLAWSLATRAAEVVEALSDRVDALEDEVLTSRATGIRDRLIDVRRQAIMLRRFIAPQREALAALAASPLSWLTPELRASLRESVDRTTRLVEDLDATRERAAMTSESLAARLAEQMNRTMYLLSVVAAVFLPLGLLTGLLGMNVGGIPGTEDPNGFLVTLALMLAIALGIVLAFRRMRVL